MDKDQKDIYELENQLRQMPREVKEDDYYSDEVEIPTSVDAVLPNSLSPVFKSLKDKHKNSGQKDVKTNKKPDYGERMRNALK